MTGTAEPWIAPILQDPPAEPIAVKTAPVIYFPLTADEVRQLKNARAIIDRLIASATAQQSA